LICVLVMYPFYLHKQFAVVSIDEIKLLNNGQAEIDIKYENGQVESFLVNEDMAASIDPTKKHLVTINQRIFGKRHISTINPQTQILRS